MPRGVKTSPEMIEKIIASYLITNSYNKTSKDLKIAETTVRNIVEKRQKEDPEKFAKVREEKKEYFADKANAIIDKALKLVDKRIESALNEDATLDALIDQIQGIDKEELSAQEKNSIISKIRKLQLNSLSELTTVIGTLYDKQRVAKGESTGNEQKFEFVLKVE